MANKDWKLLRQFAFICGLLLPLCSQANDTHEVVEVRVPKLPIYSLKGEIAQPQFEKIGEVSKEDFKAPWPVIRSSGQKLEVRGGDKTFWVTKYQVKTNRPINVPAECGAVVSSKDPKIGSVRGLGEECSK